MFKKIPFYLALTAIVDMALDSIKGNVVFSKNFAVADNEYRIFIERVK